MNFISMLIPVIKEIIHFFVGGNSENKVEKKILEKNIPENVNAGDIYSKDLWKLAKEWLLKHRDAYLAGYIVWGKGGLEGKHDNLLYAKDGSKYLKVLRDYNRDTGLYTHCESIEIAKDEYNADVKKGTFQTYCNIFASVFTEHYCGFRICKYDGTQLSANGCFDALAKGIYNSHSHIFENVSLADAIKYANNGGLALASWRNPKKGKSGHIAVLTGLGSAKNPGHVGIFQAGMRFGFMSFRQGFGLGRWSTSKFYIWRGKV